MLMSREQLATTLQIWFQIGPEVASAATATARACWPPSRRASRPARRASGRTRGRQRAEGVRWTAVVGVLDAQCRRVRRTAVGALVDEVQPVLSAVDALPARLPLEGAHRRRIVADLERSAHGRLLAGAETARARRRSAAMAVRAGRTCPEP